LGTWMKDKLNYVNIAKNADFDKHNYACAIYIVRLVSPLEMVENVLKFDTSFKPQRFRHSLALLAKADKWSD
jgi:hypothetical protein